MNTFVLVISYLVTILLLSTFLFLTIYSFGSKELPFKARMINGLRDLFIAVVVIIAIVYTVRGIYFCIETTITHIKEVI